ncbi:hypothetical protein PRIPAC_80050 [Pristionchus pacificus]|uniref:Uncharacterized protein n=1 Tax=Pristionchus pacificus TaxID=54126 RepID=A0A2A6CNH9_PRIPA|nr:hypothetical protein PRIPAC_80050 [Pristionchus pacificus]|eukprot:PDM79613.1 hypothetical protein PRIPAC_32192 [Pristionchus pacificus]
MVVRGKSACWVRPVPALHQLFVKLFCFSTISTQISAVGYEYSYKDFGSGQCKKEGCDMYSPGQCFIGNGVGTVLGMPMYAPVNCFSESEQFCYTLESNNDNVHSVVKNCGLGLCTKEGCEDVDGGKKCCCKENLCNDNGAAASSLVMVAIAAAAAAWLR